MKRWFSVLLFLLPVKIYSTSLDSISRIGKENQFENIQRSKSIDLQLGVSFRVFGLYEDQEQKSVSNTIQDLQINTIRLLSKLLISNQINFALNIFSYQKNNKHYIQMLDFYLELPIDRKINVIVGRFVPPTDRSNISGIFYLSSWDFPFVQKYPSRGGGRDDGISIWGDFFLGKFNYKVGLFRVWNDFDSALQHPLFSVRAMYNFFFFFSGYYTKNIYLGEKDIVALGLTYINQTTSSFANKYKSIYSVDVFAENKRTKMGGVSLDATYYSYSLNTNFIVDRGAETGYYASMCYLLPEFSSVRYLQVVTRYQEFLYSRGTTESNAEIGLNYFLNEKKSKLSLFFNKSKMNTADIEFFSIKFGFQFII